MLQLALAALLAGSLITGSPDGDKDKDKDKAKAQEPIESIIVPADGRPRSTTPTPSAAPSGSRSSFGSATAGARTTRPMTPNGDEFDIPEVTAQRAFVGAQINVINFTNFSVGAGGQLIAAQNKLTGANPAGGDLDSGFSLQNVKAYGVIRGRTLALHGGYIFDLGPDGTAAELAANGETANSDQVDAWFVGADFDYPSERVRVFAGIDYFNRNELATMVTNGSIEDDEIIVFNAGAGLKISWVEIGAAALLRTNLAINRLGTPDGWWAPGLDRPVPPPLAAELPRVHLGQGRRPQRVCRLRLLPRWRG